MIMNRFVRILLPTLLVWPYLGFADPYLLRVMSDHLHPIGQDGRQFPT